MRIPRYWGTKFLTFHLYKTNIASVAADRSRSRELDVYGYATRLTRVSLLLTRGINQAPIASAISRIAEKPASLVEKRAPQRMPPLALDERANRAISVRFPINDRLAADADDLIKARTRNSARSMCNRFKRLRAPHSIA